MIIEQIIVVNFPNFYSNGGNFLQMCFIQGFLKTKLFTGYFYAKGVLIKRTFHTFETVNHIILLL